MRVWRPWRTPASTGRGWRRATSEFVSLLETFLIAAVATVLIIRTELWLTNYPQLGGHGLHIAHLLYGGVFMAVAIGILLMFLGRGPWRPAGLIGGIGFGFFIDELGKFITEDNNYFYKPAAGVIYVVFITMFLVLRLLAGGGRSPPRSAWRTPCTWRSTPRTGGCPRASAGAPSYCSTAPINPSRSSPRCAGCWPSSRRCRRSRRAFMSGGVTGSGPGTEEGRPDARPGLIDRTAIATAPPKAEQSITT